MAETIVIGIARLVVAARQIGEKKGAFFGVFAAIFFLGVWLLGRADLLPSVRVAESAAATVALDEIATAAAAVAVSEEPVKVEAPTIGLSASVANPQATDAKTLDALLLKGAVRYPTSALLGQDGNVVLFGHSSYLPVVGNQAYKTFNGIQKLAKGDTITVSSAGRAYAYRVRSVEKESAASDAGIDLAVAGRVLTLVTCNSFAQKSDRFVVTADFVESHSISTL